MSPELLVMMGPTRAYRRLAPGHSVTALGAVRRPAMAAVILGAGVSMYATERVTAALVAETTLFWTYAIVIQIVAARVAIAARRREVTAAAALDLLFMGQGPWTLWLLAMVAWALWLPRPDWMDGAVGATAIVPMIWTAIILQAFFMTVLHATPRAAALRTLAHQFIVWTAAAVYIALAIGLWPRVLGVIGS